MLRENLIKDDTLSEQLLDEMLNKFLTEVNDGSWKTGGWPQMYTYYSLSKIAINVYVFMSIVFALVGLRPK
jgi:carbonyl reductase 1